MLTFTPGKPRFAPAESPAAPTCGPLTIGVNVQLFSRAKPRLDFGATTPGATLSRSLRLTNDHATESKRVTLARAPSHASGLHIETFDITVPPTASREVDVLWTPASAELSLSATFTLAVAAKRGPSSKITITAVGSTAAKGGKGKKKGLGASSSSTLARKQRTKRGLGLSRKPLASKQNASVVAAKKKKKTRRASIKSKTAAAAASVQKAWVASQEASLTAWFNHVIDGGSPSDDAASSSDSVPTTPGRANAFKELVQTRSLERARRSMRQVFRSAPMRAMRAKIDAEVALGGSLTVRRDRHMYADVGLQAEYMRALMEYNPRWLRVALETVVGERIEGAGTKRAMKLFIHKHMLHDADLTALYSTTIQGLHGEEYINSVHRHALRNFLTTAVLLDFAKVCADKNLAGKSAMPSGAKSPASSQMRATMPTCLFRPKASCKSSNAVLQRFASEFLHAVGDVTRQLSAMGCALHFKQGHLAEYRFRVTDLAVDLKDGVRLCRLLDMLKTTSSSSSVDELVYLCDQLRVPATNLLRKKHNVELALTHLHECGVAMQHIKSADVTKGDKSKTLALLWRIVVEHQLERLVNEAMIVAEIETLGAVPTTDLSDDGTRTSALLLQWCGVVCARYECAIADWTTSFSSGRALCLLVHHYHPSILPLDAISDADATLEISSEEATKLNFSLASECVSTMGCVPMMLGKCDGTTMPEEQSMVAFVAFLCARLIESSKEVKAALTIQGAWATKRNARKALLYSAATVLQRIARRAFAMASLESAREQLKIKDAAAAAAATALKLEEAAAAAAAAEALKIEKAAAAAAAEVLKLEKAAAAAAAAEAQKIEEAAAAAAAEELKLEEAAAAATAAEVLKIKEAAAAAAAAEARKVQQAVAAEKQRIVENAAAVTLQCSVRRAIAIAELNISLDAVVVMQAITRRAQASALTGTMRRTVRAASLMQCTIRAALACKGVDAMRHRCSAATSLQTSVRVLFAKKHLFLLKLYAAEMHAVALAQERCAAATRVQTIARARFAKKEYHAIQVARAMAIARERCSAATSVQTSVRVLFAKKRLFLLKLFAAEMQAVALAEQRCAAATSVQTIARMRFAKKHLAKLHATRVAMEKAAAAVALAAKQAAARAELAHRQQVEAVRVAMARHFASHVLQSTARRFIAKCEFVRVKKAVVRVQGVARSVAARAHLAHLRAAHTLALRASAAQCLQCVVRMAIAKASLDQLRTEYAAARRIQGRVRIAMAQADFEELRNTHVAAICLQSLARCMKAKVEVQQLRDAHTAAVRENAATQIQTCVRGTMARVSFEAQCDAALTIQCSLRCCASRAALIELRNAHTMAMRESAATQIQTCVRGTMARVSFETQCDAALTIQCSLRCSASRAALSELRTTHAAAMCMQGALRAVFARSAVAQRRSEIAAETAAAFGAAVRVQCAVRIFAAKAELQQRAAQCVAATQIQSAVRRTMAVCRFDECYAAIIIMQSVARIARAVQTTRGLRTRLAATLTLQCCVRSLAARCCAAALRARVFAAVAIQSRSRVLIAKAMLCGLRTERVKQQHAATQIQSIARRRSAAAMLAALQQAHGAAIVIQSAVRCVRARTALAEKRTLAGAAVTVQSQWRTTVAIVARKRAIASATTLQAVVRGACCRASDELVAIRAKAIQRRAICALRNASRVRQLAAALHRLQEHVQEHKAHCASRAIQVVARAVIAMRTAKRRRAATCMLNKLVRGGMVRRNSTSAVRRQSRRIAKVNREADPEMTIGKRIVTAVEILRSSKNLGRMMKACISLGKSKRVTMEEREEKKKNRCCCTLGCLVAVSNTPLPPSSPLTFSLTLSAEAASRLSVWCCKSFVEDEVAVNTMFEVLRLCNRSEPHRKLISVTLTTLLNISRDPEMCAPLMGEEQRVGTIAFTAERYKEYNGIFSQACALLCGAAQVDEIRAVSYMCVCVCVCVCVPSSRLTQTTLPLFLFQPPATCRPSSTTVS